MIKRILRLGIILCLYCLIFAGAIFSQLPPHAPTAEEEQVFYSRDFPFAEILLALIIISLIWYAIRARKKRK